VIGKIYQKPRHCHRPSIVDLLNWLGVSRCPVACVIPGTLGFCQ
jgi:hypothetical protein